MQFNIMICLIIIFREVRDKRMEGPGLLSWRWLIVRVGLCPERRSQKRVELHGFNQHFMQAPTDLLLDTHDSRHSEAMN